MKARFVKKAHQSSNIYSFYFKPNIGLNYIPGQFIELTLPFKTDKPRGNKRWFSLSSSPNEKHLAITTRIFPERSTFKKNLYNLKPDSEVDVSMPMGDFVLPKDSEEELVFIAIGIGITPFRSIINYLPIENKPRNITLIFANKNKEDFIFNDLLSSSGVNYIRLQKQLDTTDIKSYVPKLNEKTIYISGPERTVEKLYKDLLKEGFKQENISVDYFHNYD